MALVATVGLPFATLVKASAAPLPSQAPSGQSTPIGQAAQSESGLGQEIEEVVVPRKAGSCPLLVPSQVAFLQPKRLKPEEVKAKNAAGCLSPADAIYGPDGCPLKLCPNPQWKGL